MMCRRIIAITSAARSIGQLDRIFISQCGKSDCIMQPVVPQHWSQAYAGKRGTRPSILVAVDY